jgi:hypothetical protein
MEKNKVGKAQITSAFQRQTHGLAFWASAKQFSFSFSSRKVLAFALEYLFQRVRDSLQDRSTDNLVLYKYNAANLDAHHLHDSQLSSLN